ncbi:hypothetical protein [Streptomyces sp. NPDC127040]|uniref:hypothetical protein n=1 Tax=Streptomyces sp. NPDC127040 TaxID=3347116 RepID=UPI00365F7375
MTDRPAIREQYAAALYTHHYGGQPTGDTWRGTRDDYLATADVLLPVHEQLQERADQAFARSEKSYHHAATFQTRLDDAREWARRNLPADQAERLYAVLRGDIPAGDDSGELDPPKQAIDATQSTEQSIFRPTRGDGTPYRHHEIVAEGWAYCDGCRTWIRGYTERNAHRCEPVVQVSQQPKETPDA